MGFFGDILNKFKSELSWKASQEISEGIDKATDKIFNKKTSGNKCPKCKKEILELGLKFCPHCGAKLMHTCPKCNIDFSIDQQFCTQCGTKLE